VTDPPFFLTRLFVRPCTQLSFRPADTASMKKPVMIVVAIAFAIGGVVMFVQDHQAADRAHRAGARVVELCTSVLPAQDLADLTNALDELSPRFASYVTECAVDAADCNAAMTCMSSTLGR
jgi:hypothetical protein